MYGPSYAAVVAGVPPLRVRLTLAERLGTRARPQASLYTRSPVVVPAASAAKLASIEASAGPQEPTCSGTDANQALAQVILGQVQAMFAWLEESMDERLPRVESQTAPCGRSRSPVDRSPARLRRSEDFSSQDESLAGTPVTISSGMGEGSVDRSKLPEAHETSDRESRSRKRSHGKERRGSR